MYTEEGQRHAREAREARRRRKQNGRAARKWKKTQARIDRGQRQINQKFRGWASQIRVRRTPYQPGQCDYYNPRRAKWKTQSSCSVAVTVATNYRNNLLSRSGAPSTSSPIRIEESRVGRLPPLGGITPALCRDLQTLVTSGERSGGWSRYKGARTESRRKKLLDMPTAKRIPRAVVHDLYIDEVEIPLYSGKDRKSVEKMLASTQKSLRQCLERVRPVFGKGNLVSKGGVISRLGAAPWAGTSPYAGQPWMLYLRMVEVSPKGTKLYRKHAGIEEKVRVDPGAGTATGLSPALCGDLQILVKAAMKRGGLRKFRGKRLRLPGFGKIRTYALKNLAEASAREGSLFLDSRVDEARVGLITVRKGTPLKKFWSGIRPLVQQCVGEITPIARNTAMYTKTGVVIGISDTRWNAGKKVMYLEVAERTAKAAKFYKVLTKPRPF